MILSPELQEYLKATACLWLYGDNEIRNNNNSILMGYMVIDLQTIALGCEQGVTFTSKLSTGIIRHILLEMFSGKRILQIF